ncbi:MAG: TonB-dependent receptor [Cyclobacteriaceae bacterium]|nr:TonB-dependent receptor [Cyclobacteriaceae bacterium]
MEELLNVEVMSVSRRAEKLTEAASAIQVITQDDIRRAGATSIPEALRLATNLHIAQKNSHDWAISARGFNTDLANKLLVLIDGRTVYTPLFSGVFWDRQDYLLADVERIEVISGTGGTLWGANAVNGVINIITKKAYDTQGFYGEAGGGSQLRGSTGIRYGTRLGEKTFLRMYGKYFNRDEAVYPDGEEASDVWWMGQGGFRLDSKSSEKNEFTFQGDYYNGQANLSAGGKSDQQGGNILGRWSHVFSERSEIRLQLYYDKTFFIQDVSESRTEDNSIVLAPAGTLKDNLDTYDLDFQHTLSLGTRHHFVWGLGYRYTHDEVKNAPGLAFIPEVLDRNLFSVFVQDEISVFDNLSFTVGTKVEHNDYTGFEYEPSMRLQWNLTSKQLLWTAVSRAVRMPSRIDRHIRIPTPGFAPIVENLLIGGANFRSETLIAYELGHRIQFGTKVTSSFSTFYNIYDRIRSTSQSPADQYGLTFPFFYENNLEGETYGFEWRLTYQVADWWRINGGYTLLRDDIRIKSGKEDFNQALNETADPRHRFSVRSFINLTKNFEVYGGLRFVDSFKYNNGGVPGTVPKYSELDLKLAWLPKKNLEVSVTGQNLLNAQHSEYVISSPNPREDVERSFYVKMAFQL